ncbi:hypothetical protein [Agromyces sp. Soil535]|uniref:hypothetical protein n=1 Tax=Agromyces sp. Soil535 TaxID=1736390 RepID=UPI001F233554|nr:hypothetical protein [Agromyces sp. Soil535]
MPKAFAAAGTMSACSCPTQPRLTIVMNCGITASWVGSMKVTNSTTNSTWRPGKRNLAKVNAAIESKNSTAKVIETVTITVFSREPPKSIVANTVCRLSSSSAPTTKRGGEV